MDVYGRRRRALCRLIAGPRFEGSQAAFSRETGVSPTYVTRMLSEPGSKYHKRIAEELALKIEEKLSLPEGTLLDPPDEGSKELAGFRNNVRLVPKERAALRDDVEIVHWDTGGAMGRAGAVTRHRCSGQRL